MTGSENGSVHPEPPSWLEVLEWLMEGGPAATLERGSLRTAEPAWRLNVAGHYALGLNFEVKGGTGEQAVQAGVLRITNARGLDPWAVRQQLHERRLEAQRAQAKAAQEAQERLRQRSKKEIKPLHEWRDLAGHPGFYERTRSRDDGTVVYGYGESAEEVVGPFGDLPQAFHACEVGDGTVDNSVAPRAPEVQRPEPARATDARTKAGRDWKRMPDHPGIYRRLHADGTTTYGFGKPAGGVRGTFGSIEEAVAEREAGRVPA